MLSSPRSSSPDIVAISPPPSPRPSRPNKRRRVGNKEHETQRSLTAASASAPNLNRPSSSRASTSFSSEPSSKSSKPSKSSKASKPDFFAPPTTRPTVAPLPKPSKITTSSTTTTPLRPRVAVSATDSRERVTERMLSTLGSSKNPITHSDAFERTAHVQSCSTGHQQRGADRGFWAGARAEGLSTAGVAQEATYWSVRTSKVEAQGREKTKDFLAGCVIAINGHTGPVSNLQLQNLITENGGRFAPHQHSGCTHVIAERLAGGKTQKVINGQGARGAAGRAKIVRVDWVLDSVAQGKRLSEAGYMVISDPSQKSLFSALGVKPKSELRAEVKKDEE